MPPSSVMHRSPSLADYDGTAGFLVDTNIWIDCIDERSPWHDWAVDRLQACSEQAPLHVNLIIYTELLIPGADPAALDAMFDVYEVRRTPLPWRCAGLAAAAFARYRGRGGSRLRPLPDFYIGAHAVVSNLSLLTRDPSGYSSDFGKLRVVSPNRDMR
ncbi:MAG: PIN domain-containing protein [Burkholderiaceae bacterium]